MDSVKLCLILTIGAFLLLSSISSAQAQDYGQLIRPRRSNTKEDNQAAEGYGSSGGNANYQFQYAVTDGLGLSSGNGNDFGHEEERNGQVVRGQYRVLLPDGRRQVVTYTADKDGYRAEIKYESVGGGSPGGYSSPPAPQKAQEYGPPPQPAQESKPAPRAQPSHSQRRAGDSFVRFRGQNHNYNYNL